MKRLGIIYALLFLLISISYSQNTKVDKKKPHIAFQETVYDFGKIPYNGPGIHKFEFKNQGKGLLIISEVKSTCGCTTSNYSKAPIKRGKTGFIEVKYNTKIVGQFTKNIRIYSNAFNSPIILQIKGIVEKNPAAAKKAAYPKKPKPPKTSPFK